MKISAVEEAKGEMEDENRRANTFQNIKCIFLKLLFDRDLYKDWT